MKRLSAAVKLPKTYWPLGARMAAGIAAVVLVSMLTFLWIMLPAVSKAGFTTYQRVTIVVVFGGIVTLLYALFRTRARADEQGLRVTNGFRVHRYAWAEIVRISLNRNRPWALLDLADGTTASVMALQSSDGERATRGAREVAVLIEQQSQPGHDS